MKIATGKLEGPDKVANYRIFKIEVESLARSLQVEEYDYGLLGFVITQAEWNRLPLNTIVANPAAVPPILAGFIPMPTIPVRPELPAPNAGAGVFSRHRSLKEDRRAIIADLLALKQAILAGLDDKDIATITDPTTGSMELSHAQIMAALTAVHGTVTSSDITRWRLSLSEPIDPNTTLAQKISQHKKTALLLRDIAAVNEFDQIAFFKAAFATQVEVMACTMRYEHDAPNTLTRTFADLATYLALHNPPLSTMTSLGYSNAATTGPSTADAATLVSMSADIATALAAIQRLQETRTASGHAGRNNYSRGNQDRDRRNASARGAGTRPTKYCFLHGYCSHTGAECNIMANDMARNGGLYTNRNIASTSHLDDTSGSKKNSPA